MSRWKLALPGEPDQRERRKQEEFVHPPEPADPHMAKAECEFDLRDGDA